VSDVDEAPPVAEPTRWVRAWEAAVGGDDDESESESEEEAPPPPHKRRRTTKTAAAPRPRTSFLSKYYGVTFKKETKKWQVQYTDASGTQKWSGLFDDEEKAARAYNSLIVELGLESRRKINKVDAAGRLVEKPQPPPPIPEADRVSRYYGVSYNAGTRKFTAQVFMFYINNSSKCAFLGDVFFWQSEDHRIVLNSRGSRPRLQRRRRKRRPRVAAEI